MKKILVLFLTVSTLALTSCGKDDSPSIIGKWYLYSRETNGKVETKEYGKCGKDYIEFKSDGKMEGISYNEEDNCRKEIGKGTYSVEGNTLKVQIEGNNNNEEKANFSINDDTMTLNTETDDNGKKVAKTLIFKKL